MQRLKPNPWIVAALILAAALIASLAAHFGGVGPFRSRTGIVKNEQGILLVSARELYENFVCSSCGRSIAECTCAEAEEKRKVVAGLVGKGLSKTRVYKEMVKTYGEEVLFDRALAIQIKDEVIAEAPKERPIIALEPKMIDLGDVPKKGVVSQDFEIKNEGKQDLVISGLESSCGCTTARVINQGVEGPIFGMEGHGGFQNPKDWSTTIKPGREATLRVFYDPTVHEDLTGAVTRVITVSSNDPINAKVKAIIELNQL